MSKHTLQLFRHLYENLPPLFPEDLNEEMRNSIEGFEQRDDLTLQEVEREMVKHGFSVWPFYKAHKDFMEESIEKMGDHFLEPHFDDELKEKYSNFKGYGGNWHDLYSGRAADYFTEDERIQIAHALVQAKNKLGEYVARDVKGISKDKYLERVQKYHFVLDEIKGELDELRKLADKEDHDILAEQIRAKIGDVEHSFAHLGKELQFHEIFNAVDFFIGRKQELSRLRGIDIPKQINFYNY